MRVAYFSPMTCSFMVCWVWKFFPVETSMMSIMVPGSRPNRSPISMASAVAV